MIAGLANSRGQALLDGGARRMRALTGYDRVTLSCGGRRSESSRGAFAATSDAADLPAIVIDGAGDEIAIFPRDAAESSVDTALLRAPNEKEQQKLAAQSIKAVLQIPFAADGLDCTFCCENRSPRQPSFELHAAAELFAQMFAMRLALDQAN